MNRHRPLRSLAILALLPLFGVVFWLTAVVASSIPNLLVVDVNVHGLTLATYAGDAEQRVAPLSLRVLDDANQDAAKVAVAFPTPGRSLATPKPAASPSPTPTPRPLPSPLPTPSPLPGPTPTPTPGWATIAGQVTDSQTRLPIAAATVSVSPGGQSVLTGANGNFSLSVSPGTYTVTAKAPGYSSASQTVTVDGGQKTNVVFRLVSVTAFGSLSGSVTDSLSGDPIVGATVSLSDGMVRVTDLNGNFSYALVLSGSYTLTVSAVGHVVQSQVVTVRTGHTTNVQISLART
jgi:carboxypeptidase family protein